MKKRFLATQYELIHDLLLNSFDITSHQPHFLEFVHVWKFHRLRELRPRPTVVRTCVRQLRSEVEEKGEKSVKREEREREKERVTAIHDATPSERYERRKREREKKKIRKVPAREGEYTEISTAYSHWRTGENTFLADWDRASIPRRPKSNSLAD